MRDRLTFVKTVYYQQANLEATMEDCRYARELVSEDKQPYPRVRITVGEEWQPLVPKGCWLEKTGLVTVYYPQEILQVIPTAEEALANAEKILEIRYNDSQHYWSLRPNELFDGYPDDHQSLLIRCRKGTTRYTVILYPE